MELLRIRRVVAHIVVLQVDGGVGGVVDFNPRAVVQRRVKKHVGVVDHDFVDDEGAVSGGFGPCVFLFGELCYAGSGCADGTCQ